MVNRTVAIQSFLLMMCLSVALAEGFSFSSKHQQTPLANMRRRGSVSSASPIKRQRHPNSLAFLSITRGGAINTPRGGVRYAEPSDDDIAAPAGIVGKTVCLFGSVWGSMGVVYILAKAIKRVLPIAMEPLKEGSTLAFSNIQWG